LHFADFGGGGGAHACQQAFQHCERNAERLFDKGSVKESFLMRQGCVQTTASCYAAEKRGNRSTTYFPPVNMGLDGGKVEHYYGNSVFIPGPSLFGF
jgi:hypothetical protein